ncbi:3-oxoacyl-ACP synthase [Mesorhizobium sp.]|uniref:3-oxoacyl-ACP synthase n=1 Tax=Mesorhizobium sp. TaxID=1871066 RepID=UPI000FE646F6|nr:3-oxoacyl-ACP synthase [Mesorhizobium sp.]RWQ01558.1 MAG: 3-oxoacyl-ACP synthase [Mesorhizobium sp.]RWQ46832.1 MAG: 3-oxoacyl-ACP synthase [Mesorhizobium sp.]
MSAAIDIASIGMVTAIGLDAPSSCAAMRAGVDGFQETGFLASGGEHLIGAPVPLPGDWVGEKRMAYLAATAITEAFAGAPEARGSAALILCLAEDDRPGRPVSDGQRMLARIAAITKLTSPSKARIVAHGRPSGLVALEQARRVLSSGEAPFVMIAGVDSYLTAGTVTHYLAENRLLVPDNPDGFIPGEAAAAILCSPRPTTGSFRLHGLGLSREPAFIYNPDDLASRGDGMTAAYRTALDETGIAMHRVGYRIADLIGEKYWFRQSALATLRLTRGRREFMDIWSPGETLGNVGAAVVPLMLGWAFTAAAKGYAMGDSVLVEASNDAGACGAAIFAGRAV